MRKDDEKGSTWAAIIRDWKESTLTQRAYCLEHDLSYSAFCYWSRAFKAKAGPEETNADVHAVEVLRVPSELMQFDVRGAMDLELDTEGIVLAVAGSEGQVTIEGKIKLGTLASILAACQGGFGHAQAR